jgi:hypothetical protein
VGNIPIIAGFADGESYASTRLMPDLPWRETGTAARHLGGMEGYEVFLRRQGWLRVFKPRD